MSNGPAMTLREAQALARSVITALQPYCDRIEVAGSVRRARAWTHDVEIVAIPKGTLQDEEVQPADIFTAAVFRKVFVRDPGWRATIERIAATVIRGRELDTARSTQFTTSEGYVVDLYTARPETWGYILAIRTGSVEYSKGLASRWVRKGYKGEDGQLTKGGKLVEVREEQDLFRLLEIQYTDPRSRA